MTDSLPPETTNTASAAVPLDTNPNPDTTAAGSPTESPDCLGDGSPSNQTFRALAAGPRLAAAELSNDAWATLDLPRPAIAVDEATVRRIASGPRDEAMATLERHAETRFDAEPVRARQRTVAQAALENLTRLLAEHDGVHAKVCDFYTSAFRLKETAARGLQSEASKWYWAKAGFWALIVVVAFAGGFYVSYTNSRNVPELAEAGLLAPIAFVLPAMLAAFVGLKYGDHTLLPTGQQRFKRALLAAVARTLLP